jgi:hypothetical protein
LFAFFGRLGFLKAKVPELVGDEVELAEGDPLARPLFSGSSLMLRMTPI